MAAPDLQRQRDVAALRDLELAARAVLAGLRHGLHASPLVGAGPEVWGLRPYRQGDEAGQVDWKRSARGDRLFSRERVDTSQTQALFVVDASRSMAAGHVAGAPTKLDVARMTAAALALLLAGQGDTVGLFVSLPSPTWIAPAGGMHHAHIVLDALTAVQPAGDTPPAHAVRLAVARLRRPSLVVVLTDGWDDDAYADELRRAAASGHDVVALHLEAPGDRELTVTGPVEVEDAETGEVLAIEPGETTARFARSAAAFHAARDEAVRGARLASRRLATDQPLVPQLRAFLTERRGRLA